MNTPYLRLPGSGFVEGTCDGFHVDSACPLHGTLPPTVEGHFCTGRRYWECPRCSALAQGSICVNCGRGAPLALYDTDATFPEDLLRRLRP